jgi:MraZ protein
VPVNLLQKASIDKDVMIIGVGKTIEIWNKTKFEAYSKEAESKYEEAAERVSNNEHNK